MTIVKTTYNRRSFLKNTLAAGGGLMIGFSWLATACTTDASKGMSIPDEWFEINGYLKIGDNGVVTILSPNPEIGQNVKTSMPMIVAEELDVDWKNVLVEQAPLNTKVFVRQLAGGSDSIRTSWPGLRMAGASARTMLRQAAANKWEVPVEEVTTEAGVLYHKNSGKKAGYGEMASAAAELPVPEEVDLKELSEFKIVGTSRKNVDGQKIVTGKPLFGLDYKVDGMLIAMIVHPPAFGMKLKSFDAAEVKSMPGIKDVFSIKTYNDDYDRQWSDTTSFTELVVVVGNTTWEVWNAKLMLNVEWEQFSEQKYNAAGWGGNTREVTVPGGLESTADHRRKMVEAAAGEARVVRRDGDPEGAFKKAAKVIERTYTAPHLAHNPMEPMNFFADVKEDQATLIGPIQSPEPMQKTVAARLGLPLEKVDVQMTRMGGGFGRRLYGHFMVEVALVSQKMKAPVKLVYTREDDMTYGIYRPMYHAIYRAALDADNNLIGFHVKMGGVPESALHANRFPAGAIDNYLAESWSVQSNISVGAMRAPASNFNAAAEQSFLDELAEEMGVDPIQFRLDLLKRAQENPVGENNDYDAARYAGVLELVREKSGWDNSEGKKRGVSAYFCHRSYVAQVLDIVMENGKPRIDNVYNAVDCGIVINPDAAVNMVEGSVVDGIGHAMYSELTFNQGEPEQNNFDGYRLIRHAEAPKKIEVFFVENDIHPTGLGEPPYPPVMAALANALYKATGTRYYHQPFVKNTFEV